MTSDDYFFHNPPQPYVPDASLPAAFLVDVDGTVALRTDRGIYDESRVLTDAPNRAVIVVVKSLIAVGFIPLFLSGRSDSCARDTSLWLMQHVGTAQDNELRLFMRGTGDRRRDDVVKLGLFNDLIRSHYHVIGAFDDRDRVVALWRNLGITCFQVAPGNF